jgi:uncharacterized protein YqfA (UPF0365 family)
LEKVNSSLSVENGRLKNQFNSSKQEHAFILEKLGAISSENGRLVAECNAIDQENKSVKQVYETARKADEDIKDAIGNATKSAFGHFSKHDFEDKYDHLEISAVVLLLTHEMTLYRYKTVNAKLLKQLAEERKKLSQARAEYANELKMRTETEQLMRLCVEDVRREIARRFVSLRPSTILHS